MHFHLFSLAAVFVSSPPTTLLVFRRSLDVSIANVLYTFYLFNIFFYKTLKALSLERAGMAAPSPSGVINLPASNRSTL